MPAIRIPHAIRWAADIIGEDAALRLVEEFGGTRVYIPMRSGEATVLSRLIGLEHATALSQAYGGETFKVPQVKHWRAQKLRETGKSYSQIARALGVNLSSVWRYLDLAGQAGPHGREQLKLDL